MGVFKGPLLEAIHLFKFQGNMPAGERLGKMMALWVNDCLTLPNYDAILPVPLHASKLRQRGFNQSLVLARQIAKVSSINVNALTLKKVVQGAPQVGLGREERRENVRGTFAVKDSEDLGGMKILLVDDVYTTGSTVRECAVALMKEGASEVDVLTLARA
ncbi:MAG: ComF family protein [Syntrophales bacterium]|nr:ComF family protein [Syntrophales bacterium]